MSRTLRGAVAIAGVGETTYYKRGQSPDAEFKLALKAILAACADAGISPKEVDGFASFSNDRSDPSRLANALGCHELRFSNMQWGGGGGGGSAAIAHAAAAVATGLAECVVVFRALAQGGADIIACPAAFTRRTGEKHWHAPNRARAIENTCFVVSPCAVGPIEGGGESYGHSLVVGPWGEVVVDGGVAPGVVRARMDIDEVASARARVPSLDHDRAYGPVADRRRSA